MSGWIYLPRFVDKIRLKLAGKLHPDYQENFTGGFDGMWLEAAGVDADTFIDAVKNTITDGQVADWVRINIRKSPEDMQAFRDRILSHGSQNDELKARLQWRKEEAGFATRDDIQTFVDFIDADEKRI